MHSTWFMFRVVSCQHIQYSTTQYSNTKLVRVFQQYFITHALSFYKYSINKNKNKKWTGRTTWSIQGLQQQQQIVCDIGVIQTQTRNVHLIRSIRWPHSRPSHCAPATWWQFKKFFNCIPAQMSAASCEESVRVAGGRWPSIAPCTYILLHTNCIWRSELDTGNERKRIRNCIRTQSIFTISTKSIGFGYVPFTTVD